MTWVSLAAAGILAASFAFALWMARSIIRPINELGENAEALARGAPGREPELPEARRVWSVLQHAWEQLRVSEDRLRRASQAAGFGIHDLEPASGRSWWSVHLARLLGLRDDDASGSIDRVWSQLHPDEREATRKRLGEVMRQVGPYELELHVQLPDGTQRWLLDCGESTGPLDPHSGLATRLTGIVIDITERKENEQRIRLLMREVTHRSKNLLSLVLAIARRTAASNPQEFLARFNERVLALSASHDLLVESDWRGIDLADLIHAQLAHFTDHLDERIVITGPPVRLQTSAAQSIGMALHELATNAGKYGALSGARGQIEIVWSLSDDATEQGFCLTWRESHGPRVITPARDGFGTLVTGELLVNALSARVDRDYAQAGFCWSLRCPARVVIEDNLETTN